MKHSSPRKLTCPCLGTLIRTMDIPLYATTSNEEGALCLKRIYQLGLPNTVLDPPHIFVEFGTELLRLTLHAYDGNVVEFHWLDLVKFLGPIAVGALIGNADVDKGRLLQGRRSKWRKLFPG